MKAGGNLWQIVTRRVAKENMGNDITEFDSNPSSNQGEFLGDCQSEWDI